MAPAPEAPPRPPRPEPVPPPALRGARRRGAFWPIALSLGLGYVVPREGSPPLNLFVSGEWMAYRENARIAPQTTVRFGMTVAFPQYRPW